MGGKQTTTACSPRMEQATDRDATLDADTALPPYDMQHSHHIRVASVSSRLTACVCLDAEAASGAGVCVRNAMVRRRDRESVIGKV